MDESVFRLSCFGWIDCNKNFSIGNLERRCICCWFFGFLFKIEVISLIIFVVIRFFGVGIDEVFFWSVLFLYLLVCVIKGKKIDIFLI